MRSLLYTKQSTRCFLDHRHLSGFNGLLNGLINKSVAHLYYSMILTVRVSMEGYCYYLIPHVMHGRLLLLLLFGSGAVTRAMGLARYARPIS